MVQGHLLGQSVRVKLRKHCSFWAPTVKLKFCNCDKPTCSLKWNYLMDRCSLGLSHFLSASLSCSSNTNTHTHRFVLGEISEKPFFNDLWLPCIHLLFKVCTKAYTISGRHYSIIWCVASDWTTHWALFPGDKVKAILVIVCVTSRTG